MNQAARLQSQDVGRENGRAATLQHWGALIGGGALAVYGLTRRSPLGYVLAAGGGALAYTGVKSEFLRRDTTARSSVTVNVSPEEAYRFWRDFENLPRFMRHLESVSVMGARRSRWVAIGPMGARVEWEAEIVSERPNEAISWRSLPDSEIEVEGLVEFRRAPGNRGTIISVWTRFRPPAGAAGRMVAKMLGKDPSFLMEQDMRRFKALVETGEIPTTEGQPHGPRDAMTAAARLMNPDEPMSRGAALLEQFRASRRSA